MKSYKYKQEGESVDGDIDEAKHKIEIIKKLKI